MVIITFNEQNNIEKCIKSAPQVSEIIVVDSFSKDDTAKVAERLGAKVYHREFKGFREQKQYACSLATQPWILSLDADEALSPELQNEMDELFSKKQLAMGYRIPRLSYHLGRWIRHGGWYPDYQTRLFNKESYEWVGGEVHEQVKIKGSVETLKNNLEHFVFDDLRDQMSTNNLYSSKGALQLYKENKKFFVTKLVFKPFWKFVECYFLKSGWKDGVAGFIIALGAAQSMFMKYAKLWELYEFKDSTKV